MVYNPFYSLAGVLVGLLVGLTGVGGGSLMTPLLVLVFGFHPVTAVGTDLLYASATKTVGTAVHGWRGTVDWRVVGRLAAGSVPTTVAMLFALNYATHRAADTGHLVATILGAVLLLTAGAILFRERIVSRLAPRFGRLSDRRIGWLTVLLGAILGALVSLTSVGAGALGITALLVLYPRLELKRLVGSDIAHAVPLTLIAGLGHMTLGAVDFSLLVSLLAGSVPGIVIGSLVATRVSDRVLVPILAMTLAVVGVKLVL
ncbi:sulfite exporter TauE/SafE family protein [Sphingomonas sp. CL5.1]|uniref:sulfite exporter TauE/SafE family protein n=1 Tax=Sphingomonas sp. CL5.1 TaxID=2653203 RepID=UPI001582A0AA|nr:sulfite exporter TauE/SafE family protein [Sphingomonas sp. CL5.1]QKS02012.1 sulfite exporter TauE/SafE family protein [Sphingomonas sp. CL5.1]